MAATNVNLLLNTQSNPNKVNPASSIRSTYFARKTYNVNRTGAGSFNNVLDRINSAPQQNPAPRDTYKSSSVESTAKSSSNDVRNPKPKTQDVSSNQKDKAPEDVNPVEKFDDDDAPSKPTAPQSPVDMSALFSTGTESLLPVREMPVEGEPVLMTVMPQQSNSDNQSMLNMLAGNTWRQLQNTVEQPLNVEPKQLIPTVEEPIAQPLIDVNQLQPSTIIEADVQPQQAASLIGGENVELNQLPLDGEKSQLIQVRDNQPAVAQPAVDQPAPQSIIQPTSIEDAAPVQTPLQTNAPLAQNPTANDVPSAQVEPQNTVKNVDATAQTQLVSNDANLSNVIDAAKNSQPRAITSDIQAPVEQIQSVENITDVPLQPTEEISSTPIVERGMPNQNEQPLTPLAKPDRPQFVEPQQPVQTQQSVNTQQTQIVDPLTQKIPVEGINQPLTPQPDQAPRTPLTNNQPVIDQPTAPVQTEMTATVEQPVIQQSTAQPAQTLQTVQTAQPQQIQQPVVEQPTQVNFEQPQELAPSNTQQIFDENNATALPRGTQNIDQPAAQSTVQQAAQPVQDEVAQPVAANAPATDAEPVHRRFHGHDNQMEAAQLDQTRRSAWRDRTAPLYQIALQQRTVAQSNNPLTGGAQTAGSVNTASPLNPAYNAQTLNAAAQNMVDQNAAAQNVSAQNVSAQNVAAQNIIAGEEVSAPNAAAPSNNFVVPNVASTNDPTEIVRPLNANTQNAAAQNNPAAQMLNVQNEIVQPQNSMSSVPTNPAAVPSNNIINQNVHPQNSMSSVGTNPAAVPSNNPNQNVAAPNNPSAQTLNTQTANVQPQNIIQNEGNPIVAAPSNNPNQNVAAPNNPSAQTLNTQTANVQPQNVIQTDSNPIVAAPSNNPNQNVAAPNNPVATNQPLNAQNEIIQPQNVIQTEGNPIVAAPSNNPNQNVAAPNNPVATNQPLNAQNEIIQPQNVIQTEGNQFVAAPSNNPNQNVTAQINPSAQPSSNPIDNQINNPINNVQPQNQSAPDNPIAVNQPLSNPINNPINNQINNQINNVQPQNQQTAAQPSSTPTNDINPQNISAAQLQGSVAQTDQNVNRPVSNIPQSFAIFGNELNINNPVTAPQQAAPFNQQFNQQTNQQFNQQSNQQSNQQAQQQVQQAAQQQFQQAVNAQSQAQTMPMAEGQTMAQMPSESFAQNLGTAVNNLNTPQPAAQAQQSTQNTAFAQQLRDDFNVAGQIVEHARMFRNVLNNSTEMVLQLKPEHLGELTLRVSVTAEGTVNASFHSDNAAVRAIIENSLVSLKQELSNQGLKVDNVEVYSGLSDGSSLMNGKGRQGWQQNNRRNAQRIERVRGGNASEGGVGVQGTATAQSVETAQPVENAVSDGGVDYKV